MQNNRQKIQFILLELCVFFLCICGSIQTAYKPVIITPLLYQLSENHRSNFLLSNNVAEWITDYYKAGDTIDSKVNSPFSNFNVTAPIIFGKFYSTAYCVIQAGCAFLFYILGVFVFWRKPFESVGTTFHHVTLSVSLLIMLTWGSMSILPDFLSYTTRSLFPATYIFCSFYFFRFATKFPTYKNKHNKAGFVLAITGLILAFAGFISSIFAIISLHWLPFHLLILTFCKIYAIALSIIAITIFFVSYRQNKENFVRRQLRWVLFGASICFVSYVLLWQIPQIFGFQIIPEELMLILLLFVPICCAIAIVRYRAFDIDVIIRKSTIYGVVLILVFSILFFLQTIATYLLRSYIPISEAIVRAIEWITAIILFSTIRVFIQKKLDTWFFKTQTITNQERIEFGRRLSYSYDSRQIYEVLIEILEKLFKPDKVLLLLPSKQYVDIFIVHSGSDNNHFQIKLRARHIPAHNQVLINTETLEPNAPMNCKDILGFRRCGISSILPLCNQEKTNIALCVVGKKKFGTRFTHEEITIMESLCSEAAISLERVQLTAELVIQSEKAQRLEELNRMKSFFVSSVSHELKTPLTSIRLFADMLVEQEVPEKEKTDKFGRIISEESQRLSRLIDNILNFNRIERGNKTYNFSLQDLNEIVGFVLEMMTYQFVMNKVQLIHEI